MTRWLGAAGPAPAAVASAVMGALWGTIMAGPLSGPLPAETERRMGSFTELGAIAIANASARQARRLSGAPGRARQ